MDLLADDLILGISQDWLNPRDQRRFASSHPRFHRILPAPLRVRICSTTDGSWSTGCLGGDWFVSPVSLTEPLTTSSSSSMKQSQMTVRQSPLTETATLYYDTRYSFWRFDYQENCPVFLGRHLRQTLRDTSPMQYRYTLGLRPRVPNQYWKILDTTQEASSSSEDNPASTTQPRSVSWNHSSLQLLVAGTDKRAGQPDSTDEHFLAAQVRPSHDSRNAWTWFVAQGDTTAQAKPTTYNSFQIYRTSSHPPNSNPKALRRLSTTFMINRSSTFLLSTEAIPDICDKGAYLLYSPIRWESHLAPCNIHGPSLHRGRQSLEGLGSVGTAGDGRSAIIEYSFWITTGILYFKAHILPFAFGVPVMKLDRKYFQPHLGPVANLFESFSARWGCIKYYMATAADVGEGCVLNMDSFIQGVTDHDEHTVHYDTDLQVVVISMQDPVDTEIPDVPRDDSKIWRFFFSW